MQTLRSVVFAGIQQGLFRVVGISVSLCICLFGRICIVYFCDCARVHNAFVCICLIIILDFSNQKNLIKPYIVSLRGSLMKV